MALSLQVSLITPQLNVRTQPLVTLIVYIYVINCREVALEYLKTASEMVKKILEVLTGALGVTADESSIVDLVDGLTGSKMVNINFYPTCPNPDLTIGVGRHSDVGTLTVLLQDGIGGLYVKVLDEEESTGNQKKKGGGEPRWMEIPPTTGALVINVGDALQVRYTLFYRAYVFI